MTKPWYARSQPDEITPYPWLHSRAVDYLEGLLKPHMQVLEHGGGGSTLWLALHVKEVVTYECNDDWLDVIRAAAPLNVTIHDRHDPPETGSFDLLFVDGERDKRGAFLLAAQRLVKPGGWIVLDNANRPEYHAERQALTEFAHLKARFDSNTAFSKFFVTEFWQCASA